MTWDPCGFSEEGADGGGGADTATTGPAICNGVVNPCFYVLLWRHAWGEKVEVGDVRRQLQFIDGKKPLWILIGENVRSYVGAEC